MQSELIDSMGHALNQVQDPTKTDRHFRGLILYPFVDFFYVILPKKENRGKKEKTRSAGKIEEVPVELKSELWFRFLFLA